MKRLIGELVIGVPLKIIFLVGLLLSLVGELLVNMAENLDDRISPYFLKEK